jgi:hypothetical protein
MEDVFYIPRGRYLKINVTILSTYFAIYVFISGFGISLPYLFIAIKCQVLYKVRLATYLLNSMSNCFFRTFMHLMRRRRRSGNTLRPCSELNCGYAIDDKLNLAN